MSARHLSAVPDPPPPTGALLDLFGAEPEAREGFGRACRRHVVVPEAEVFALRSALARRGHRLAYADVEAALYALALEEMPGGWAAGRERLRRLVEGRDGSAPGSAPANAPRRALEDLAHGETAWLRELALLAEDAPSYERLREVSAGAWAALKRRGKSYPPEGFTAHVRAVGWRVFPLSPGFAHDADAPAPDADAG